MLGHLTNPEACPFGSGETVREVNSRKSAAELAAIRAETEAVIEAVAKRAAEREAKLAAAPFVISAEWDEARKGMGDIRDACGVPVSVVPAYVWREATGVRTLVETFCGHFVATREGFAPADGPLVDATTSEEFSFELRYSVAFSATSEWLPANAYEPKETAYEPQVNALWLELLGDASDAVELRQWQVARAAKAAKAAKSQKPTAEKSASPFAALAALKG